MNIRALILATALLLPSIAFPGLSGTYKFWGKNPVSEKYRGTATITEKDSVYTFTWHYDDGGTDIGTGVRKGDHLAVVFHSLDSPTFYGTILYAIDGKELKGPYVGLQATKGGFDHMKKTKKDVSPAPA